MVNSLIALLDGLKLTGRAISSEGRLAYATVGSLSYNGHCDCEGNCQVPSGDYCPAPSDQ